MFLIPSVHIARPCNTDWCLAFRILCNKVLIIVQASVGCEEVGLQYKVFVTKRLNIFPCVRKEHQLARYTIYRETPGSQSDNIASGTCPTGLSTPARLITCPYQTSILCSIYIILKYFLVFEIGYVYRLHHPFRHRFRLLWRQ